MTPPWKVKEPVDTPITWSFIGRIVSTSIIAWAAYEFRGMKSTLEAVAVKVAVHDAEIDNIKKNQAEIKATVHELQAHLVKEK